MAQLTIAQTKSNSAEHLPGRFGAAIYRPCDCTDISTVIAAKDAFAMPAIRLKESFPSVRLPVLGNVILRSMSSESLCQRRYGFADSESCAVGQAHRQAMKNALEWIGQADRREKTWCDVSSLGGYAGVLFAYPSERPENAPRSRG